MSFLKRKANNDDNEADRINKATKCAELCPHGERCYRKNPHHFREFDHPHLNKWLDMDDDSIIPDGLAQPKSVYIEQLALLRPLRRACNSSATPSTSQPSKNVVVAKSMPSIAADSSGPIGTASMGSTMLAKLSRAQPYNLFFTVVPKAVDTLKPAANCITFTDLLCPSLGSLKCSLQINFMIDIMWLMEQYRARQLGQKPLTILYGDEFPKMDEFIDKFLPNVTHHFVKMKDPFGCHHSKIGIYVYDDNSLRVVVSTANLYYEDWNHYNQGLWLSPLCKKLPEGSPSSDGDSPTGFKTSLLTYLRHYKLSCLNEWIKYVERADFTDIRVFLVLSMPGKHYPNKSTGSHLHRVADLLLRHCTLPVKTTTSNGNDDGPLAWCINAQASSIGSLGKAPADWLRSTLLRSLAAHNKTQLVSNSSATLNVIFPTVDNVMKGHFGPESGGCLPYSKQTNEKQRWLQQYLHQWKSNLLGRSRAMPHCKTYCRVSPCLTKLAWFLITSANMSKSAWGGNLQKDGSVYVRSYEAGVMFLPKFFDEEWFEIAATLNKRNPTLFPFIYDLPLTCYKTDDYPWCN